jgi:hypothetical protein
MIEEIKITDMKYDIFSGHKTGKMFCEKKRKQINHKIDCETILKYSIIEEWILKSCMDAQHISI